MFEMIVDGLLEGSEKLTFTLKSRANISRRQFDSSGGADNAPTPKEREISFPGNTAQEAWNFS
jgi:meiotic recombination protein SPO11